jgi:hypothetical protein
MTDDLVDLVSARHDALHLSETLRLMLEQRSEHDVFKPTLENIAALADLVVAGLHSQFTKETGQ